jgi:hypothetical protein
MKKETAARFTVSLPPTLLKQLDGMCAKRATTTARSPSPI